MDGATGTLLRALAFAAERHSGQRRKDAAASPYINHPIDLANVLANEAGIDDERVLIAAILHDTVEDTMVTLDAKDVITEVYGHSVTAGSQVLIQGGDDPASVTQVLGPGDVSKRYRPKGSGIISLGHEHVGTTVIYEQAGVRFELPVWGEATGNFWARRTP